MLERTWGHGLGQTRLPPRGGRPADCRWLGGTEANGEAVSDHSRLVALPDGFRHHSVGSARRATRCRAPVPIRVPEYRLRHGHSQTDGCWRDASSRQWDACRPICGRFVVTAPDAPPLSLIHISEPTRRTPISYAVFCLTK